jgi:uridylate kinase
MIVIQKKRIGKKFDFISFEDVLKKRFKCNGHHSVYIEPRKQITDRSFDMNKIGNLLKICEGEI